MASFSVGTKVAPKIVAYKKPGSTDAKAKGAELAAKPEAKKADTTKPADQPTSGDSAIKDDSSPEALLHKFQIVANKLVVGRRNFTVLRLVQKVFLVIAIGFFLGYPLRNDFACFTTCHSTDVTFEDFNGNMLTEDQCFNDPALTWYGITAAFMSLTTLYVFGTVVAVSYTSLDLIKWSDVATVLNTNTVDAVDVLQALVVTAVLGLELYPGQVKAYCQGISIAQGVCWMMFVFYVLAVFVRWKDHMCADTVARDAHPLRLVPKISATLYVPAPEKKKDDEQQQGQEEKKGGEQDEEERKRAEQEDQNAAVAENDQAAAPASGAQDKKDKDAAAPTYVTQDCEIYYIYKGPKPFGKNETAADSLVIEFGSEYQPPAYIIPLSSIKQITLGGEHGDWKQTAFTLVTSTRTFALSAVNASHVRDLIRGLYVATMLTNNNDTVVKPGSTSKSSSSDEENQREDVEFYECVYDFRVDVSKDIDSILSNFKDTSDRYSRHMLIRLDSQYVPRIIDIVQKLFVMLMLFYHHGNYNWFSLWMSLSGVATTLWAVAKFFNFYEAARNIRINVALVYTLDLSSLRTSADLKLPPPVAAPAPAPAPAMVAPVHAKAPHKEEQRADHTDHADHADHGGNATPLHTTDPEEQPLLSKQEEQQQRLDDRAAVGQQMELQMMQQREQQMREEQMREQQMRQQQMQQQQMQQQQMQQQPMQQQHAQHTGHNEERDGVQV